jgi:hypothetical protein
MSLPIGCSCHGIGQLLLHASFAAGKLEPAALGLGWDSQAGICNTAILQAVLMEATLVKTGPALVTSAGARFQVLCPPSDATTGITHLTTACHDVNDHTSHRFPLPHLVVSWIRIVLRVDRRWIRAG